MSEWWAIVANVLEPGPTALRRGARVVVTMPNGGGGYERMEVTGLSKGGRPITTWIATKNLRDVRPGFMHDESARGAYYPSRAAAQRDCDVINGASAAAAADPYRTPGEVPPAPCDHDEQPLVSVSEGEIGRLCVRCGRRR